MKTIGNKYPCCRKPTGLHHEHWEDDAVLDKECPRCGTEWIISFERVQLPSIPGVTYRKLNFVRKRNRSEQDDSILSMGDQS